MSETVSVMQWVPFLVQGLYACLLMCCCAVILSRAGRSPYWALFAINSYALIMGVFVLALVRWPQEKTAVSKTPAP